MASFNYGNPHPDADASALERNGSSLFSLTFEEFQKVIGEPGTNMGSMNMDDLLRNIWTAEESQAMAAAMNPSDKINGQFSLQKQGSLSLPRTLSGKSVEDVWKSLQPEDAGTTAGAGSGTIHHQRQMTLGEVTLEDFLVRAGVVKATPDAPAMQTNLLANQVHAMTRTHMPASQVHQPSASTQLLAPSNQLHLVQASMKTPNQVPKPPLSQTIPSISLPPLPVSRFVGFGGNFDFPFQSVGGSQTFEDFKGLTSPGTGKTLVPSSSDVLSLPDRMRFEALDSVGLQGKQGDWVNSSHPKSITQQNQHGQVSVTQQQCIPESASVLGSKPTVATVPLPFLVSTTRQLSPSSGGTGAALGAGGGLGLAFGGNAIHFGSESPLSPSLDEMSPETSDLPLSLIAEFASGHQHRKKRCGEGPVEKLIERRQRRMIKNRESAARSRARKQAYTVELEAEVSQLKEENMKLLRKQEEDAARRKQQILALVPSPAINAGYRKLPLKRTYTGPW